MDAVAIPVIKYMGVQRDRFTGEGTELRRGQEGVECLDVHHDKRAYKICGKE